VFVIFNCLKNRTVFFHHWIEDYRLLTKLYFLEAFFNVYKEINKKDMSEYIWSPSK